MPNRPLVHLPANDAAMRAGFDAIRAELGVEGEYPAAALAEARAAATRDVSQGRVDATAVEFVTIDPPGSRDLDQALHLERVESGFRLRYAIADLAAFVEPGGALDAETHRRGETYYLPDDNDPLHPRELSEGAASLLPEVERPALLWQLDLDSDGALVSTEVRRAMVRSRAQLDYAQAQRSIDDGTAPESLALLRDVGRLRLAQARERGAVSLDQLEQQVERDADGQWVVAYRAVLDVESWNAELSLLTGMAAAALLIDGRVGLLRTLPAPPRDTVASFRRSALALGVPWPGGLEYGTFVSGLNAHIPAHAALLRLATMLVRGAGYVAFDGTVPVGAEHSAVAAPYTHVTAPLRRLVDRYTGAACVALCAGDPLPVWVRAALPRLPAEMAAADSRAHAMDRAVVDLAESVVLSTRVGETFAAVVVEAGQDRAVVQLRHPAVRARCDGSGLALGQELEVRLVTAEPARRQVLFAPA